MTTRKRLFFALWPDAATREALVATIGDVANSAAGRPVRAENLHITLAFLGSVPDSALAGILAGAGRVTGQPFDLRLDRFEFWRRQRLLWLGPWVLPDALCGLHDALWHELAECDFAVPRRRFEPHVTLARNARKHVTAQVMRPCHWPVSDFALLESVTHPDGAVYHPLAHWPLGAER